MSSVEAVLRAGTDESAKKRLVVVVGLLPTYAQVGVWAPVLLVLMRLTQGLAVGGEYGGAATYVAERSRQRWSL